MQVCVIPNCCSRGAKDLIEPVCRRLSQGGASVQVWQGDVLPDPATLRSLIAACDIVVAVGGDGTLVHIAKAAAELEKPVVGVNGGHLGFLTGLEENELSALDKLVSGDYAVEQRRLLEITVEKGDPAAVYYAMNEAVISRGSLSRLVDVRISGVGRDALEYRGDGVIIATPTGSTAYSLSAGGPVVDPSVDCLLVTPVCPHTLDPRSHILSPETVLTVSASTAGEDTFLTVDGEKNVPLHSQDTLTVKLSRRRVSLIRLGSNTFQDDLNKKLLGRR